VLPRSVLGDTDLEKGGKEDAKLKPENVNGKEVRMLIFFFDCLGIKMCGAKGVELKVRS